MRINGQQRLRYERNIVKLYNEAAIDSIISGIKWYREANKICHSFAQRYSVSLDKVCAVMAVLSPASSWENNIKSTEKMINAYSLGLELWTFNVATYGQNKKKAWSILTDAEEFKATGSNLKIWSFYNNILNPDGADHVTVDRHAIKVLQGEEKAGSVAITPRQYRIAEQVYKDMAVKFELKPHELQAILWIVYKQKVGR